MGNLQERQVFACSGRAVTLGTCSDVFMTHLHSTGVKCIVSKHFCLIFIKKSTDVTICILFFLYLNCSHFYFVEKCLLFRNYIFFEIASISTTLKIYFTRPVELADLCGYHDVDLMMIFPRQKCPVSYFRFVMLVS